MNGQIIEKFLIPQKSHTIELQRRPGVNHIKEVLVLKMQKKSKCLDVTLLILTYNYSQMSD